MKPGTDKTQWLMDFLRALSGRAEYHYSNPEDQDSDPTFNVFVRTLREDLWRTGWMIEEFHRLDTPGHGSRIVVQLRVSRPPA